MRTVGGDHAQCTYGHANRGRIVGRDAGTTAGDQHSAPGRQLRGLGLLPVVAVIPLWLLALAIVWLPLRVVWHISFVRLRSAISQPVLLLFLRPVQVMILAPLARRPATDAPASGRRSTSPGDRCCRPTACRHGGSSIAVLPIDELNAFACGGHLVVVTSYAIDTLPRDELSGVLAHELSHHLGSHTVALTIGHWLSLPVLSSPGSGSSCRTWRRRRLARSPRRSSCAHRRSASSSARC